MTREHTRIVAGTVILLTVVVVATITTVGGRPSMHRPATAGVGDEKIALSVGDRNVTVGKVRALRNQILESSGGQLTSLDACEQAMAEIKTSLVGLDAIWSPSLSIPTAALDAAVQVMGTMEAEDPAYATAVATSGLPREALNELRRRLAEVTLRADALGLQLATDAPTPSSTEIAAYLSTHRPESLISLVYVSASSEQELASYWDEVSPLAHSAAQDGEFSASFMDWAASKRGISSEDPALMETYVYTDTATLPDYVASAVSHDNAAGGTASFRRPNGEGGIYMVVGREDSVPLTANAVGTLAAVEKRKSYIAERVNDLVDEADVTVHVACTDME